METIRRSWCMGKRSVAVMTQNPRLLWYPVLVCVITVGILLFFFTPLALQDTGHHYSDIQHWKTVTERLVAKNDASPGNYAFMSRNERGNLAFNFRMKPSIYVFFVTMYFVLMFLGTFFNVALCHEIINGLNGNAVSVTGGFLFAARRSKAILFWALLSGSVGLVIKGVEQKFDVVGRFAMRMLGVAWSVASVFAIPVIIREEATANPLTVLRRSAGLIRKTWGEALVGYTGLQGLGIFCVLAGIGFSIVTLPGVCYLSSGTPDALLWLLAGWALTFVVSLAAFLVLVEVLKSVFLCAVFIYASEGVVPVPFDAEAMDAAWHVK